MNGEESRLARREGAEAARRFRLPFGRQAWRGAAGGWQGAGAGSSIDFQDHRAYVAGDDPRHLHWAAYARTGQLTMKLYRAEVAPRVDVAVDASESMRGDGRRAARTEGLAAFCIEAAARAGAATRLYALEGGRARAVEVARARAEGFWGAAGTGSGERGAGSLERKSGGAEGLAAVPWRAGAMKVWVSDLLFPGEPARVLNGLVAGGGCALVFAPVLAEEAELAERGNVELVDPEAPGGGRRQRIDGALAERYRAAYARHFALWGEAARRAAAGWARVDCAGGLAAALAGEALAQGVVEAG